MIVQPITQRIMLLCIVMAMTLTIVMMLLDARFYITHPPTISGQWYLQYHPMWLLLIELLVGVLLYKGYKWGKGLLILCTVLLLQDNYVIWTTLDATTTAMVLQSIITGLLCAAMLLSLFMRQNIR